MQDSCFIVVRIHIKTIGYMLKVSVNIVSNFLACSCAGRFYFQRWIFSLVFCIRDERVNNLGVEQC